jgi:hypothetical protein
MRVLQHQLRLREGKNYIGIKGTVARDFRLSIFFHQTIPPRALIPALKPFRIWLRIRRENRLYSNFSGVNDTAESDFGDFRSYYLGEYDAICKTGLAC